ncbi:hypothetical protein [Tenacibaculum sp. 190524A02b]|uniref:hypothetical protein n=1 Tax=Tenacibaculum vairaonense TaxID=3137860 RepID=UPI0031FB6F02
MYKIFNVFWKGQNWFGRIQSIGIIFLVFTILYYKGMYSLYKKKEIEQLLNEKKMLQEALLINNQELFKINYESKALTQALKSESKSIEDKRKEDENYIYNSTITSKQRHDFITKYESKR